MEIGILKIGDHVMYFGKDHEVVHVHNDGLVNLKDGWFYVFNVHPMMLSKIMKGEIKI